MDMIQYFLAKKRMCNSAGTCDKCAFNTCGEPIHKFCHEVEFGNPLNAERIVEEWVSKHPTRQDRLLKYYPNAAMAPDGILEICPNILDDSVISCWKKTEDCSNCMNEYWMQEICDNDEGEKNDGLGKHD